MNVNLTLLELYFDKIGYPVTTFVATDGSGVLSFQAGKPEQNGGLTISIEAKDLLEILYHNNIIGEDSLVRKIMDDVNNRSKDEQIEKLVYELLSGYLYQMMTASRGKIYSKNIIPLPKHLNMYFREAV